MASFSNGEITLIAAVVSAAISGVVSILTARYVVKHGPNYEEQIDGLNEKFEAFHETYARAQENILKQQAELADGEEARYQARAREIEAAKWKPVASIVNVNEGQEHVNKLAINAFEKFRPIEASIHASNGAKLGDLPGGTRGIPRDPVVGALVHIPHNRLVQLS
jgi:Skp family chaperone for outer membrane proteins